MSGQPQRAETLCAAIDETAALIETNPAAAETRALEILKKTPGQPQALRLLVESLRRTDGLVDARRLLENLAEQTPGIAAIPYELGLVLNEVGDTRKAAEAFSRAVELEPQHPQARRALSNVLANAGPGEDGVRARAEEFENGRAGLGVIEAAARGGDDQLPRAEALLREWLSSYPTDVSALQMLGSVYIRLRRFEDAEQKLSKALDLAPAFPGARWMLAGTFFYRGNWQAALSQADRLLENDPNNSEYADLKSFALLHLGESDAAIACYESSLSRHATAECWKSYGHALKVVGRQQDAIAAYRKSIAMNPDYGLAWWCLADLKTFRFAPFEIEAMKAALERPGLSAKNRARFHYALGKAFEDQQRYEPAFAQYVNANAAMRTPGRYNAADRTQFVRRCKSVFTPKFFQERSECGFAAGDPIFVLGLPRSGTTLIEQILASHSQVEATIELQVLESVVRRLSLDDRRREKRYPEMLQQTDAKEIRSAADEYLAETRVYRKLNRPFFIDKMPNNFNYLGLILLMLPKARIIDARRHPLGSGLAIFKHYFAEAYAFAFDLSDIGHFYRNYVELMAHFDAVAPGRIHRVFYERMVVDTETEIRRLLDYCGLPFEEQCLRFYESRRTILTPSSEQVRRPIFTDAADLWRHYETWLGPLKLALGDVLETYPEVPNFGYPADEPGWQISSTRVSAHFTTSLNAALHGPQANRKPG